MIATWKLTTGSEPKRTLATGSLRHVAEKLMTDDTARKGSRGVQSYWIEHSEVDTCIHRFGSMVYVCSAVGDDKSRLTEFMNKVTRALKVAGGIVL